jgi:Mor family transcriptional regulator
MNYFGLSGILVSHDLLSSSSRQTKQVEKGEGRRIYFTRPLEAHRSPINTQVHAHFSNVCEDGLTDHRFRRF